MSNEFLAASPSPCSLPSTSSDHEPRRSLDSTPPAKHIMVRQQDRSLLQDRRGNLYKRVGSKGSRDLYELIPDTHMVNSSNKQAEEVIFDPDVIWVVYGGQNNAPSRDDGSSGMRRRKP
ncbi:hypothetical protein HDU97_003521 [Phlyctochytrium planicorne]|nr:hypothetical protein HDU97_003521 [Phlyctochytrium planicorne]